MITILLNIIFGIIIDTFAELRSQKTEMEEDIKNICFICNIDRQIFDKDTEEGFEYHTENDHNVWQYLNFIIHLKSIDSTDLNGTESYILELFEKQDISWFPMQKSQRLIMIKQDKDNLKHAQALALDNDGDEMVQNLMGDPVSGIPLNIDKLQQKVREVSKKF